MNALELNGELIKGRDYLEDFNEKQLNKTKKDNVPSVSAQEIIDAV